MGHTAISHSSRGSPPSPDKTTPSHPALAPPDWKTAAPSLDLHATTDKPTADQCLAHLKVLEAFHQLREDVATTDGLYGIYDRFVDDTNTARTQLLRKIREKRWAVYVTKATKRFEQWWHKTRPQASPTQGLLHLYQTFGQDDEQIVLDSDCVPPLDVLMVWHAYLLNPRDFLDDCIRFQWIALWNTGFPLGLVSSCIDDETFVYRPSDRAPATFLAATGLPWKSLIDNQQLVLRCPNCNRPMHVPWTTATDAGSWRTADGGGENGKGYTDPLFEWTCSGCHVPSHHDSFKVQKFKTDAKMLIEKYIPLPGTVLNMKGRPQVPERNGTLETHSPLFPNRLVTALRSAFSRTSISSVNKIRTIIETGLGQSYIRQEACGRKSPLNRNEKLAVRKMMSHYWNNSSVFALDLVGAVIRQGTFIEKMHALDWLHSPAPQPTMDRALLRHTHQLYPPSYYHYSVLKTDRFIDHDDKIPSANLSTGFEWTSKIYQSMYQEPYSECACWYCTAVRESHTSAASRLIFSRSAHKSIDAQLTNTSNEKISPHISAHSAIDPENVKIGTLATTKDTQLNRMYEKARKRAEKKGREPPDRANTTAAGHTYAYGIPERRATAVRGLVGEGLPQGRAQEERVRVALGVVAVGVEEEAVVEGAEEEAVEEGVEEEGVEEEEEEEMGVGVVEAVEEGVDYRRLERGRWIGAI
ncbi:MAG: hypothetical protein Q9184_007953 [Pyrenodesmia sp. 2 TL-2023]